MSARHCIGEYVWRRRDGLSLEHAQLDGDGDGFTLHGALIAIEQGRPMHVDYHVHADSDWVTREVRVALRGGGVEHRLTLAHDGTGRWSVDGVPAAHLHGCLDVDLELSPITNTLPISRGGGDVRVAWVRFPSLRVDAAAQRYVALGARRWRFESTTSGFAAHLTTDDDGVVVDYEDLFERISGDAPTGTRR